MLGVCCDEDRFSMVDNPKPLRVQAESLRNQTETLPSHATHCEHILFTIVPTIATIGNNFKRCEIRTRRCQIMQHIANSRETLRKHTIYWNCQAI